MAIDDAEKRRAAAGVSPVGAPGVTPNASKDAEWRAQVGKSYSGIGAEAPSESNGSDLFYSLGSNLTYPLAG